MNPFAIGEILDVGDNLVSCSASACEAFDSFVAAAPTRWKLKDAYASHPRLKGMRMSYKFHVQQGRIFRPIRSSLACSATIGPLNILQAILWNWLKSIERRPDKNTRD